MAGEARTTEFSLSTATVMIGPMEKAFDLTPDEHSIGLVKNFQMTSNKTTTDLTHGVQNTIVYSVVTGNEINCSMEVYEYTAKNMAYAAGFDNQAMKTSIASSITAEVVGADAAPSFTIASDTDNSADYPVGAVIVVQSNRFTDLIYLGKITAVVYDATGKELEITTDRVLSSNITFPVGSVLQRANFIPVGAKVQQPYYAAKIVAVLPENNEPVTIIIPKMRITQGMTLGFQTDSYGNMPFEFTPFDMVATDPFYDEYQGYGSVFIYKR